MIPITTQRPTLAEIQRIHNILTSVLITNTTLPLSSSVPNHDIAVVSSIPTLLLNGDIKTTVLFPQKRDTDVHCEQERKTTTPMLSSPLESSQQRSVKESDVNVSLRCTNQVSSTNDSSFLDQSNQKKIHRVQNTQNTTLTTKNDSKTRNNKPAHHKKLQVSSVLNSSEASSIKNTTLWESDRRRESQSTQEPPSPQQQQQQPSTHPTSLDLQRELVLIEQLQAQTLKTLSDRDRRLRAVEIRLKQAQGTLPLCANCKQPLTLLVPFQRLAENFCSLHCVQQRCTKKQHHLGK
jgi:hypothetical protein